MKQRALIIGLFCLCLSLASGQSVKDPVKYFYKTVALLPSDKITVIEGDLTGNGRYSFLISDGRRSPGLNEGYAWDIYYPTDRNSYLRADASYVGDVPSYIGYVDEINRNGVVQVVSYKQSNVVSVQFLVGGMINASILFDDTTDYKKKFPKYFGASSHFKLITYTYKQLKKKWGNGVRQ